MPLTLNLLPDPNLALMKAMNFNEDMLHLNRQGLLSKSQRTSLDSRRFFWGVSSILILVLSLVIIVPNVVGGSQKNPLVILAIGFCVTYTAFIYTWSNWYNLHKDLGAGRVTSREGAISVSSRIERSGREYWISMENKKVDKGRVVAVEVLSFRVSAAVADAVDKGKVYRLYYAPRSKTALSAELAPPAESP